MALEPMTPSAGGAADIVKETTTQAFAKDVIEASKSALVLVDFWADWCGPCKQLAPLIEKVVRSYKGKVQLVKLNVDKHPAIAGQLRIQSLPTVYAFRDGRPLDGFMGAQPESAIREFCDRLLGDDAASGLAEALDGAEADLEKGDLQSAAEIFAAVLEEDREEVRAIAGLARCYLMSGDNEKAKQTLALAPPAKRDAAPIASVRAQLELAEKAGSAGDLTELEQKVKANPADHQARLDLAIAAAAGGNKERAVDELIELFRRDRNWSEGAARAELVNLFEAWGPKDAATVDGRRRLSSLMFA